MLFMNAGNNIISQQIIIRKVFHEGRETKLENAKETKKFKYYKTGIE